MEIHRSTLFLYQKMLLFLALNITVNAWDSFITNFNRITLFIDSSCSTKNNFQRQES